MSRLLRAVTESHVFLLVFWTVLVGVASLFIFVWLLDPSNIIYHLGEYSAPAPRDMSQESSGYFGALGGWAIGFAGALVAIRIAGVATSIQQNDSLRAREEVLEAEVDLISGYNSKIIMALLEAKRACAAVLIDIQHQQDKRDEEQYKRRIDPVFLNNLNGGQVNVEAQQGAGLGEEAIFEMPENRHYLISKLTELVREIESAVRDPAFIHAARAVSRDEEQLQSLDEFCSLLASRDKGPEAFADVIKEYSKVIVEDGVYFDFIQAYENATHNFAAGINDLRAGSLYQTYPKDIEQLIAQMSLKDEGSLKPSEAAWLLLGMLLLQEFGEKPHENLRFNQGFLFIALMLGSLPNNISVYAYFSNKLKNSVTDYNKQATQKLDARMRALAETVYFPRGISELDSRTGIESGLLREINDVLICNIKKTPSLLLIMAKTRGLSQKAPQNGENFSASGKDDSSGNKPEVNLPIQSESSDVKNANAGGSSKA